MAWTPKYKLVVLCGKVISLFFSFFSQKPLLSAPRVMPVPVLRAIIADLNCFSRDLRTWRRMFISNPFQQQMCDATRVYINW